MTRNFYTNCLFAVQSWKPMQALELQEQFLLIFCRGLRARCSSATLW